MPLINLYKNDCKAPSEEKKYMTESDIMKLYLKPFMYHLNVVNKDNYQFNSYTRLGHLKLMAGAEICQLGSLNAQSFTDRMNWEANLIVTKKRTSTIHDLFNKITIIIANNRIIIFFRSTKYGNPYILFRFSDTDSE